MISPHRLSRIQGARKGGSNIAHLQRVRVRVGDMVRVRVSVRVGVCVEDKVSSYYMSKRF